MKVPTRSGTRGEEKIAQPWLWHHRTLQALRRRLMREHDEHRQAASPAPNEHEIDQAVTAGVETERDVIFAEVSAEENALAEIEAALERLRRGSYGICEETGKPIPAERLRAVPWTRYTRAAAERHERRVPVARTSGGGRAPL
jgi:RNA polymerase-binding transcription factor DksA